MCTSHQACLIKCILRPLKTLQRAHLASRQACAAVCLSYMQFVIVGFLFLLPHLFQFHLVVHTQLCESLHLDRFHFLLSFNVWLLLCGTLYIFLSRVLLSDLVPLIFHSHTPAQSLKYLLLLLQTHHSLSPQSFSLLSWHKCMFVHSFQRTHACVSVHKQKSYAQGSINSTSIQCTSKCMTSRVEGELFPKGTSASFLFITLLRR